MFLLRVSLVDGLRRVLLRHSSTSIRLASIEEVLQAKAYLCFVSVLLTKFCANSSYLFQYEKSTL